MNKIWTVRRQNIVKMKYIEVYIRAGSTLLQNAKDACKICRLNMKNYSESSLYIKEEYKCFLLHFLNKKKHIFFLFFTNILWSCYDITIPKAFFTKICSFKPKKIFLIYLLKFIKILIFWWIFNQPPLRWLVGRYH